MREEQLELDMHIDSIEADTSSRADYISEAYFLDDEPPIQVDGFDGCIVGVLDGLPRLIYDKNKIIGQLMSEFEDDGDYSDDFELYTSALEYFEYNIERSLDYIPEGQRPIIMINYNDL